MPDPVKCARCGAALSEADQAKPDKMKLCADCRSAATLKAPQVGSD